MPGQPSGVKRLLHLASFALSSLPVMLRQVCWKLDAVLVIEPPLMCGSVDRRIRDKRFVLSCIHSKQGYEYARIYSTG